MSIVDKMLGAVTPPESEETGMEATRKARAIAEPGDWLSMALDHHDIIRRAFDQGRQAQSPTERLTAMKSLALVLNGHSLAEEIVLYPAMAKEGHKPSAMEAYTEQTTAKLQMAELERIDPSTPEWADKLEHIQGAVLHHIYEEESGWFVKLKQEGADQAMLTQRFREEFERYAGSDAGRSGDGMGRSSGSDMDRRGGYEEPRSFV